jgi:hypothetical protein
MTTKDSSGNEFQKRRPRALISTMSRETKWTMLGAGKEVFEKDAAIVELWRDDGSILMEDDDYGISNLGRLLHQCADGSNWARVERGFGEISLGQLVKLEATFLLRPIPQEAPCDLSGKIDTMDIPLPNEEEEACASMDEILRSIPALGAAVDDALQATNVGKMKQILEWLHAHRRETIEAAREPLADQVFRQLMDPIRMSFVVAEYKLPKGLESDLDAAIEDALKATNNANGDEAYKWLKTHRLGVVLKIGEILVHQAFGEILLDRMAELGATFVLHPPIDRFALDVIRHKCKIDSVEFSNRGRRRGRQGSEER